MALPDLGLVQLLALEPVEDGLIRVVLLLEAIVGACQDRWQERLMLPVLGVSVDVLVEVKVPM